MPPAPSLAQFGEGKHVLILLGSRLISLSSERMSRLDLAYYHVPSVFFGHI